MQICNFLRRLRKNRIRLRKGSFFGRKNVVVCHGAHKRKKKFKKRNYKL